jgi:hypothetical protein
VPKTPFVNGFARAEALMDGFGGSQDGTQARPAEGDDPVAERCCCV